VVTKYDCWSSLLGNTPLDNPWVPSKRGASSALDKELIQERSRQVRKLLWELSPEIVAAAESFAQQVIFVPVSAMGRSPDVDPQTGAFGIRPRDIHPRWAEVPLLYFLAHWMEGIIPYRKPQLRRVGSDGDGKTLPLKAARDRKETA